MSIPSTGLPIYLLFLFYAWLWQKYCIFCQNPANLSSFTHDLLATINVHNWERITFLCFIFRSLTARIWLLHNTEKEKVNMIWIMIWKFSPSYVKTTYLVHRSLFHAVYLVHGTFNLVYSNHSYNERVCNKF